LVVDTYPRELIQWLDYLGYDEAWIGENRRAGGEILSSQGLFIAVAADRSYALLARYVMRQFHGTALGTAASDT
jgi:hypothetical protein